MACDYSDGSRVGTITKFSKKGIAFKTWEGELVMGGMRSHTDTDGNSSVVANVFVFSVTDESVVPKVQQLLDNGHRAKLVYHQILFHNPTSQQTSYAITDVVDLDSDHASTK